MQVTRLVRALPLTLALAGLPVVAAEPDAGERSRAFTDEACTQMNDAMAALDRHVQVLQGAVAQALTQTHIEVTRELAPLMHRFADELRDLARELEQPRATRDL